MHARASYLCNDLHLLCWFSLSHSMLLVSIAISSTFPFKLFYWFLWFSGPFLSIPASLMWFNLLPPFDSSQVNQFILYSTPKSSGLQLSPRNLHLDIPLPSNTRDWCSASCFPPSLFSCTSPFLSPGLTVVLCSISTSSLPVSHYLLVVCIAYCQVSQTGVCSPSLAQPLSLPLLQPLCSPSKYTPSNLDKIK